MIIYIGSNTSFCDLIWKIVFFHQNVLKTARWMICSYCVPSSTTCTMCMQCSSYFCQLWQRSSVTERTHSVLHWWTIDSVAKWSCRDVDGRLQGLPAQSRRSHWVGLARFRRTGARYRRPGRLARRTWRHAGRCEWCFTPRQLVQLLRDGWHARFVRLFVCF